jgi:hypothetical protein
MIQETITTEQLGKLLDFIDSLEKLNPVDWVAIYEACADYDIPLIKPGAKAGDSKECGSPA